MKLFESDDWQQFEADFWEETPGRGDKNTHIEAYVARMMITKRQGLILLKRDAIFKEYKNFAKDEEGKGLDVRAEIRTISEYVDIYKYLVGENQKNPLGNDVKFGYFMYGICKSMDFYPTIFAIAKSDASSTEKQNMIYLLESYVIRRHVCDLTASNYNKQALQICRALDKKPTYEKLAEHLKGAQESSTRQFPSADQVAFACLHHNFYKNKLKKYIFEKIAHHATTDRDEMRDLKGLAIDHILPQGWRDKAGWAATLEMLQPDEVDLKINTIGNLTPMSKKLNSAKSNRGWEDSNGAKAHLAKCDLKLTRELADNESWTIKDIDNRSRKLAVYICEIWPENIE